MPNYRLSIDLSDVYRELQRYDLREYRVPFMLKHIEAENPDDACHIILKRIIKEVMEQDSSIDTRILCQKLKKLIRIDKIESL